MTYTLVMEPVACKPTPPNLPAAFVELHERSRRLLRDRVERLRSLEHKLQDQLTRLLGEFDQQPSSHESEAELFARIEGLEAEVRRLQNLRRDSELALDEARIMLAEMEGERRTLREKLDQADGPDTGTATAPDGEELDRLHRRLEMAMQELRELKAKNTELKVQRSEGNSKSKTNVLAEGAAFDWESQKKRLIQELNVSENDTAPLAAPERSRIEEVICTTDRVVAEKDREIADLRQRLEVAAGTSVSAQADATEQTLNADDLVRTERAKLSKLQEEWNDKLRKAEIEISIERAKLAREKLSLEEKLRTLQDQIPTNIDSGPNSKDAKPGGRGRWLTRLGLTGE